MNNKKNKNKLSSSFLTTTPEKGKKTALKLLNKYAESFNSIKDENFILKKQIEDLNLNLKINKSIIENFFSDKNNIDKEKNIIYNIKQENKYLYEQKELLEKKNMELLNKIHLNELAYIETMNQTKEENESLKTKIFILEQSCQKKDNIIDQQKYKLNVGRRGTGRGCGKYEIYVTNPSKVVNNINNELLVYKDMYKKLTDIIKDNRINLERYEKKIIELQNENQTLRQEYKSHIFSSNKERETLMNTIQRERNFINNTKKNLSEDSKKSKNKNKKNGKKEYENKFSYITETGDNLIENEKNNKIAKYKKYLDNNSKSRKIDKSENLSLFSDDYFIMKINRKQFEHEDFIEIIKNVGLTLEKFEYMSKLKSFSKFTEIIEMLLNLVKDKERHMAILKKENEYLNENNFKLNEENIMLTNQIKSKESLLKSMKKYNNKKDNNNNNTDNNCINQKLKNTIHLYKEYLDNNQQEDSLPSDIIYDIKPKIIQNHNIHYSNTFSNGDNSQKKENNNDTIVYNNNNDDNNNHNKNKDKISDDNVKKININEEKNNMENNVKSTAVRIPNEIEKKNFGGNNKFTGTLISVTSSEFREGCPGPDSFFSTIKFDDMNGTQKTNGLKEIQKYYTDNQNKS